MTKRLKKTKNNGGDSAASDESSGGGDQNGERWVAVLEASGGIIFFAVACGFSEAGIHSGALICYFLCVWCGLLAVFHYAKESIKKYRNIAVICSLVLFFVLGVKTDHLPEDATHLSAASAATNIDSDTAAPALAKEPSRLIDEVLRARPAQREYTARGFVGIKVRWLVRLRDIEAIDNGNALAFFVDGGDGSNSGIVVAKISPEQIKALQLSEANALFYVSGTISDIDALGVKVIASNLEAYSRTNSP